MPVLRLFRRPLSPNHFAPARALSEYSLQMVWHHEHRFEPLGDGRIEITDRVTYALPFGPLGGLVHPLLVKPQLSRIFAFREHAVNRIFH